MKKRFRRNPLSEQGKSRVKEMKELALKNKKKPYIVGHKRPTLSGDSDCSLQKLCYEDIRFKAEELMDASIFLPIRYDLCRVYGTKKGEGFEGSAWVTESDRWDGLKINDTCKIKFWRRTNDNDAMES